MEVSETCPLIEYKEFHRNTHHEGGNEGNNSEGEEDQEEKGGQRVKC
jgi:hypothetical protein